MASIISTEHSLFLYCILIHANNIRIILTSTKLHYKVQKLNIYIQFTFHKNGFPYLIFHIYLLLFVIIIIKQKFIEKL